MVLFPWEIPRETHCKYINKFTGYQVSFFNILSRSLQISLLLSSLTILIYGLLNIDENIVSDVNVPKIACDLCITLNDLKNNMLHILGSICANIIKLKAKQNKND